MSADVSGGAAPDLQHSPHQGLSSPPDSNTALKLDGSDSELSDLEDQEEDIGDITPDHYADEGRVPVFKPTTEQFKDFKLYMSKIDAYGMKSGIVKVIPPAAWRAALPPLDDAIKTIRIKDPIKQDIMGTAGTYRQANILHQRSYNLPQWRQLCEQSEHQPPAKRGERRPNQEKMGRGVARNKPATTNAAIKKKRNGRPLKKEPKEDDDAVTDQERLPTPVSPSNKDSNDSVIIKHEADDEEDSQAKPKGGRQAKAAASVSSRRKYNRREAANRIDEAAFKDFKYQLDGEDFSDERCEELERAYWKTLTYAPPFYGADMVGSLFDERTTTWNLGNLENLLDVLGTKIPGVNTAYLYLGMWKATFAWHLEDVDLYSINYLHFGAPKQWYSISQADARRFEAAMKSIWPTDAKACDQFLRHKTFLVSPSTLLQNYNIKVNKIVHHPGEFVVTYPYGYHSGYNLGYNCAEAVNFALDSWLDYGRIAKKCDCSQAQDSVWIDVGEIERKLAGIETEDEFTDEEDEDDDGPTDLPTPPESSGDTKAKTTIRKRKRNVSDKGTDSAKKIRVRIKAPSREPCALCPNDISSYPLLQTEDGRKVHRLCASYIPETDIEASATGDIVTNMGGIDKARLGLRCGYCHSKKGACFQCSFGKCVRSFHATCAAAAGVLVEEGVRPVFGEDGTEYKERGYEFSCRFHRTKRDKKIDRETLQDDVYIREAASLLAVGDTCQMQHFGRDAKDVFAGIVVENRRSEEMLLIDILPKGDRVEVEYGCLRLPEPSDLRLPKPSANAIPMPASRKAKESLNTSKRQADDLPRKDDIFVPGFTISEFNTHDLPKNSYQVHVDLSRDFQLWHYLGKSSTEAKAQYTEDPAKQREHPRGRFLDTIPKPVQRTATSRTSMPASYPINQQALNASRTTGRSSLPASTNKADRPYIYKPRLSGSGEGYRVDPQAYRTQQSFLQHSIPPPYAYGSDPRWRPADDHTSGPYPSCHPPQTTHASTHQLPQASIGPERAATSTPTSKPNIVLGNRPLSSSNHNPQQSRPNSNSRSNYKAQNPFLKYPYLQLQHNRSPLDYKSPYSQTGGFMNGYEGNLKEYLRQNPEALFSRGRGQSLSQTRPKTPNPLLAYPQSMGQSPSLQVVKSSSKPSTTSPFHPQNISQQQSPLGTPAKSNLGDMWQKKSPSQFHPAIKQECSSMFHQSYQPPKYPETIKAPSKSPQQSAQQSSQTQPQIHGSETLPQFPTNDALSTKCASASPQGFFPSQQIVQSGSTPTLPEQVISQDTAEEFLRLSQEHPHSQLSGSFDHKPVYAHQQYFQNPKSPSQWQDPEHGDVPDVPTDSTSLIEQMMSNLKKASARGHTSV
ncbi:MAG: hypothetical protein M1818_003959 [Claussenomyces sp. TS43310]|nr:MAG: hypothetical protein M1818_003959 [Claussenomyces sp. TS43310]